jgi:hypothetical protein
MQTKIVLFYCRRPCAALIFFDKTFIRAEGFTAYLRQNGVFMMRRSKEKN